VGPAAPELGVLLAMRLFENISKLFGSAGKRASLQPDGTTIDVFHQSERQLPW
jgi:hypothetical protein